MLKIIFSWLRNIETKSPVVIVLVVVFFFALVVLPTALSVIPFTYLAL